jgi:hypothetical protein
VIAGAAGEQFENSGAASTRDSELIFQQAGSSYVSVPASRFDFSSGETVIPVPAGGVTFAAELFGTGTLTLPTVIGTSPASSGNSGKYMGVVYTIDGDVPVDFEMTFSLDNGAVFAENPVLGVKDGAGSSGLNVSALSAGTMTLTGTTGLTTDAVFRFDSSANTNLYQVVTNGADPASTANASVTFLQLGSTTSPPAGTFPTPTVTSPVTVYSTERKAVASLVIADAVTAVAVGTDAASVVQVKNPDSFTTNWSYMCATAGYASGNTSQVFKVTSKVAATGTTPARLLVTTATTGGTNTFDGSQCTSGASVYRVHVIGDTAISVNSGHSVVANHVYQFDNLGAATPGINSLHTTQYVVTKTEATTIHIQKVGSTTSGLEKTIQDTEELYDVAVELGDEWATSYKSNAAGVPKSPASSAAGKSSATFSMRAGMTTPATLKLFNNDQIMLLYKLGNANALAEPAQSINMTVDLKTPTLGMVVNPQRTITVAKSVQALSAQLKSIEGGRLNISVSTGSTQFSGEKTDTGLVGYVDNYVAQIGQVTISKTAAMMEDGVTEFAFPYTTTTTPTGKQGGLSAENSTLTITGGQFEASKTLPGKVSLSLTNGTNNIYADQITSDAAGWTATWNLNTTELSGIANSVSAGGANGAYVQIRTDGKTAVNTVENNPHATLNINYDTATYQDVTEEADFRKITKDGTVCTVYNVPPPTGGKVGADQLNIRITNDSAIAGKLMGKLYTSDGGEPVWTGTLTMKDGKEYEVAPGATVRLTSDDLVGLTALTGWEGANGNRGVLEISTILPKVEVLTLIRQQGIRMGPLSNLSAGAHGVGCSQK